VVVRELITILGFKLDKKGLKAAEQRVDKLKERINRGVKIAALAIGAGITALGVSSIRAASDFEESNSKFETVFSNIKEKANEMANVLQKDFGLSTQASVELLGGTGDLLTGLGFTQDMALGLSNSVVQLGADLASFSNFAGGAEGASKALEKALLGERESIKALGIIITEKMVKARIKQLEAMGKVNGMTEQQKKSFATLALAQEQSKNAIGDNIKTQNSFANASKRLINVFKDIQLIIGTALLPLITKLTIKMKGTAQKVKEWAKLNKDKLQKGFERFVSIVIKVLKVLFKLRKVILAIIIGMTTFVVISKIISIALTAMAVATKIVTAAQWLWNAAMNANPIGLIVTAIAAFVGFIIILIVKWRKINALIDRFIDKIKRKLKPAIDGIGEFFGKVFFNIKKAFAAVVNVIIDGINFVTRALNKVSGITIKQIERIEVKENEKAAGDVKRELARQRSITNIRQDVQFTVDARGGEAGGTGLSPAGAARAMKTAAKSIFNLELKKLIIGAT